MDISALYKLTPIVTDWVQVGSNILVEFSDGDASTFAGSVRFNGSDPLKNMTRAQVLEYLKESNKTQQAYLRASARPAHNPRSYWVR